MCHVMPLSHSMQCIECCISCVHLLVEGDTVMRWYFLDLVVEVEEQHRRTRGHMDKLKKRQCLGDMKKYSFPRRTIEMWNILNEEVVAAKSVLMFKEQLDKFGCGDRT